MTTGAQNFFGHRKTFENSPTEPLNIIKILNDFFGEHMTFFLSCFSCSGFCDNGVKLLIHDIITLMVTDNCATDIVFSGEKPAQDWG